MALHWADRRPLVVAHRGASAYAPENTVSAFERAIAQHADLVEFDCQLTCDGHAAVIHDSTLDRTSNGIGHVFGKTMDELRTLDAGSWFGVEFPGTGIPSVEDVLGLLHGRVSALVELKAEGGEDAAAVLVQAVLAAVHALDSEEDVILQSFSMIVNHLLHNLAPTIPLWVCGEGLRADSAWRAFLDQAEGVQAKGINVEAECLGVDRVRDAHSRGLLVAAWTVDSAPKIIEFSGWGVDAIVTNRPDHCRALLATDAQESP